MNNRIIYFLILGIFIGTLTVQGQTGTPASSEDNQEKIKALKVAFFTEQLNLSASEAARFWPMYNAYESEKDQIMSVKRKEVFDKIGGNSTYTEAEAKAILSLYRELESREAALVQKFQSKMATAFSATRTLKLFRAEHEFRIRLLREYRKRNGNVPHP
ncbi:MAG: hypothetical protein RLZZ241_2466 [Bacteroidota bacterium]|jgi:Spy/CpxP family protein refolding chaperone